MRRRLQDRSPEAGQSDVIEWRIDEPRPGVTEGAFEAAGQEARAAGDAQGLVGRGHGGVGRSDLGKGEIGQQARPGRLVAGGSVPAPGRVEEHDPGDPQGGIQAPEPKLDGRKLGDRLRAVAGPPFE